LTNCGAEVFLNNSQPNNGSTERLQSITQTRPDCETTARGEEELAAIIGAALALAMDGEPAFSSRSIEPKTENSAWRLLGRAAQMNQRLPGGLVSRF